MYDYDNIKKGYYDDVYNSQKGVQYMWHYLKFYGIRNILDKIKYNVLVDIACSSGTFISLLPQNKRCIGIDISEKQIELANSKYGSNYKKFITSDVSSMPFENNSVDVMVTIEFIEHIPRDVAKKMLVEIHRCLKPGGKLILTTPNYRSMWPVLERIVSKVSDVDYTEQHITHYNVKELKCLLGEVDMSTNTINSYLFISPFFAIFSNRLSKKIFDIEFKYIHHGNLLIAVVTKE